MNAILTSTIFATIYTLGGVAQDAASTGPTNWGGDTWTIISVLVVASGILITMAFRNRDDIKTIGRDSKEAHERIGNRINDLDARITTIKDDLTGKCDDVKDDVVMRVNAVKNDVAERIDGVKDDIRDLKVDMGSFRGATEEQIRQLQQTGITSGEELNTLNTKTGELTGAIEVITRLATTKPKKRD